MAIPSERQRFTFRQSLDCLSEHPTLEQFFGSGKLRPCQKLVVRILEDALECLLGKGYDSERRSGTMLACERGTLAKQTQKWILDDSQEPSSFLWCCYSLGWENPERVRKHMLQYTNHGLISLSENVRFTVWKIQKHNVKIENNFRGALEIAGKRINIGRFPSRRATIRALNREFQLRRDTWTIPQFSEKPVGCLSNGEVSILHR